MLKHKLFLILLPVFILITLGIKNKAEGGVNMNLSSPDFKDNGFIPNKFTCAGPDINPALLIENIPQGTKSLALIVDDPDASMGIWTHWVVYDIPVALRIEENSIPGKQGINDSGTLNYHGPCPPSGTHRYLFKIYALDKMTGLKEGASKKELENIMQGHILDKAQLTGLYKK